MDRRWGVGKEKSEKYLLGFGSMQLWTWGSRRQEVSVCYDYQSEHLKTNSEDPSSKGHI